MITKVDSENKVAEIEFVPNEVYAVDIVMSTGDGKPRETEERTTTIYKRSDVYTHSTLFVLMSTNADDIENALEFAIRRHISKDSHR